MILRNPRSRCNGFSGAFHQSKKEPAADSFRGPYPVYTFRGTGAADLGGSFAIRKIVPCRPMRPAGFSGQRVRSRSHNQGYVPVLKPMRAASAVSQKTIV